MTIKLLVRVSLVVLLSAASASGSQPERPQFYLYSWSVASGVYRFALIPAGEQQAFLFNFTRAMPSAITLEGVKTKLRSLPKNSLVTWTDARCIGIPYPSKEIRKPVSVFARENQIDLRVNFSNCE